MYKQDWTAEPQTTEPSPPVRITERRPTPASQLNKIILFYLDVLDREDTMNLTLDRKMEAVLPNTTTQVFPADFKTEYILLYNMPKATSFGGLCLFWYFFSKTGRIKNNDKELNSE